MHRISLLLAAGLLAMVPSTSAIYVEGYEPPTWHDVTFEVRATRDGIEIVLAEGDFSQVQQGHHLNVTVVNALEGGVDITLLSTWHGNDTVDGEGNVDHTTRLVTAFDVAAGGQRVEAVQLPNDTFRLRFEADDGAHEAAFDQELFAFLAASTGEPEPALEEGQGDDADGVQDKGSPGPGVALVSAGLLAVAALLGRRK